MTGPLLPLALAGTAFLLLGTGVTYATVNTVVPELVPAEIHHTVTVQVRVSGEVGVRTPDLGNLRPGLLIPERLRVDGLPEEITVKVPVNAAVRGTVEGHVDGQVKCEGCAP